MKAYIYIYIYQRIGKHENADIDNRLNRAFWMLVVVHIYDSGNSYAISGTARALATGVKLAMEETLVVRARSEKW